MIVMPDQDAVLAVTAETSDMQGEIDLVWKYLLPAMHQGKLPENKVAEAQLQKSLKELALLLPSKHMSKLANEINGKSYTLVADKSKFNNITIKFGKDGTCHINLKGDTAPYELSFGNGSWFSGLTNKPGPSLTAGANENRTMLVPAKVAGSYTWMDDHRLALTLRYIESPHTETFVCEFDANNIIIHQTSSVNNGKELLYKGSQVL